MVSHQTRRIRLLLWSCGAALALFACLQAIKPRLETPPVRAEIQAPPEVKAILKKSCYNCHSNETKLAWFDQVVPIYWIVAHDVHRARKHVNFSEIGELPVADQKAALFDAVNQIQLGAMPLPAYRKVHPEAVVMPAQLEVLKRYLMPEPPAVAGIPSDIPTITAPPPSLDTINALNAHVQDTLGGVPFDPTYKTWHQIGITERLDNNTIRVVLANDIAINAITRGQFNPWPDGTKIAKATWREQRDETGLLRTGPFVQVEMMARDREKYKRTAGWGWGRWLGNDLRPDPKTADLNNACIDCHSPMRANDYVFTMPIKDKK
jgi:hypothetical protein